MPEKRLNFRKKMRKPRYSTLGMGIGRFYVLALSRHNVRFFACTPEGVEERRLDDRTPTSIGPYEAVVQPRKPMNGNGLASGARFATEGPARGREDEKIRLREFLEDVSDGVERAMAGRREPIVLATVWYEAEMFRAVTRYPYVTEEIVAGNPDRLSAKDLHRRAMPIMRKRLAHVHLAGYFDSDQTSRR